MNRLGNGLNEAGHRMDELSVREAELSMRRRLGSSESDILAVQSNLAGTYQMLGRLEEAKGMLRDVYSGRLKLQGQEHELTFTAANNYASSLAQLHRFEEAKALLRRTIPVARRVRGDNYDTTLRMRFIYGMTLYTDPAATLNDLREAVTTLEETARTARQVLGGAHSGTFEIERALQTARERLRARESQPGPGA